MGYFFSKRVKQFFLFLVLIGSIYAGARLYYFYTDGFSISNISTAFDADPRWDVHPLVATEQAQLNSLLDQSFHYLGKGCQSYVFLSDDGNFVVKFFKYQRYRPKPWVDWFSFIPLVETYRQDKLQKKRKKLERVYASWKLAFDHLQPESGVVYAHLNNHQELNRTLTIFDKMGYAYDLELDPLQFLIQRKATMICDQIESLMSQSKIAEVKDLLDRLLAMMVAEHARGFVDEDHALMQNTGVIDNQPIHIDVGLFSSREDVKNLAVSHQELFKKTYKFRMWLQERYADLAVYLDQKLYAIIGEEFLTMHFVEDQH